MVDKPRFHTLQPANYAANDIRLVTFSTDTIQQKNAAGQAEDLRLLRATYDQLFDKKFPNPDERVEYDEYKAFLLDQKELPVSFSILVQHQGQPDEKILGLKFGTYYPDSRVGLHTYLARQDGACVQGVDGQEYAVDVKALHESQDKWFHEISAPHGGLRGLVSEADIPSLTPSEANVMDPDTRLRLIRSYGGQVVPIDYYQAALAEGKAPVPLVLLSYPIPGSKQRATNDALADWLKEFHTRISALPNPLEDDSYKIPAAQVATIQRGEIPEISETMQEVLAKHGPDRKPPAKLPAGATLASAEQMTQQVL